MADRTVRIRLEALVGQFKAQMAQATAAARGLQGGAMDAASGVRGSSKAAAQGLKNLSSEIGFINPKLLGAGGLVYGLKSTADAAIGWESAFAGVRKTVDATESELGTLSDGLRRMSTEIPVTAVELAGIAESAGQLGIETGSIEGFTRVMADLGVATNMTAQDAATQLARMANITQMSADDFDRLGSVVVDLGNNLATTEVEIVEMGLRLSGAGAQIGMSEDQILGLAGALSSVGIEAEAGGSALSKVMIEIASQVENGGDKLDTFARVAGMSASEFSAAWREDAAGALVAFVSGLGRMEDQGGSTLGVLEELEITEVRMRDALLRTSGAGEVLTDALGLASEAWEENNALTKEAEQRYGTTESQMKMAKNAITDLKVELGNGLLPVLGDASSALTDLLRFEIPEIGTGRRTTGSELLAGSIKGGLAAAFGLNFGGGEQQIADAEESTWNLGEAINSVHGKVGEFVAGAGPKFAEWLRKGAEGSDNTAGAQSRLSAWVEDTNGKIQHQIDLWRETNADPVSQLLSALDAVEQAQDAYATAVAESGAASEEAKDAGWDLFEAILDLQVASDTVSGRFEGVESALRGLESQGLLTGEQVDTITALLGEARDAAEEYEGTYSATVTLHVDPELYARLRELGRLVDAATGRKDVAIGGTTQGGFLVGTMHSGGWVTQGMRPSGASRAGLAADEVPAILQTGELVLSRQQASSLAAGGPSSSSTTTVGRQVLGNTIIVHANDPDAGMRAAANERDKLERGYI